MLCWYASNVFLMCGTGMNRTLLSCDVMFSCHVLVCIKCVFHVLMNVVTLHTLKTHTNARAHTLTGGFNSYVGVYTAYVSGRHFLVPGLCHLLLHHHHLWRHRHAFWVLYTYIRVRGCVGVYMRAFIHVNVYIT